MYKNDLDICMIGHDIIIGNLRRYYIIKCAVIIIYIKIKKCEKRKDDNINNTPFKFLSICRRSLD